MSMLDEGQRQMLLRVKDPSEVQKNWNEGGGSQVDLKWYPGEG